MAFTEVSAGQTIAAAHHNEIIKALNGTSGYSQLIALTQTNNAASYALDVRNLDSTYSYGLRVRDEADATILLAAKAGVTVGKKLVMTGLGTFTSAADMVSVAATWNNGSDAFNAFKANITNTASAATSRLIDLQVASASKFSVSVAGNVVAAGTAQCMALTIDQGAADTNILELHSSDVGHGITTLAPTTCFGAFGKNVAAEGDLWVAGFGDAGRALDLHGYCATAPDTTHTAAGVGAVNISAYLKNGTGTQEVGANGNLLCVRNGASTKFIVDAEGDLFNDGAALQAYDEHDDAKALWDMSYVVTQDEAKQAGVTYNAERLESMGIVHLDEDGKMMVSHKAHNQLVRGAIGQLYQAVKALEQKVAAMEKVA
jgi:hypothetical protein